jgi:hypothetical protein
MLLYCEGALAQGMFSRKSNNNTASGNLMRNPFIDMEVSHEWRVTIPQAVI